jgi:quinoprotein dehydrogenase-associated probable ABC transporter substrate-binding protein
MSSLFRRLVIAATVVVVHASAAEPRVFRVCADPNNLPFSSESQAGLENRLAVLIADGLAAKLEFSWWSERKSFLRNSLNAGHCDAVMGVPSTLESVAVTRPYYRSTYVTVTRSDRHLDIRSLLDDALENCRIGVHVTGDDYAPPAQVLARRGLSAHIIGFNLFGADGEVNPAFKLLDAVTKGDIDVGIVWGPFAGYYAHQHPGSLDVRPVVPSAYFGTPFTYPISVAVRKSDTALRDEIDRTLDRNWQAIQSLVKEYGIPSATGEPAKGIR